MPLIEQLAMKLDPAASPATPDPGLRCAAVAVVLHAHPGGPRVLLMKRAERDGDPWSGHISLPGGRYEPEDGDLVTTAIRESREELDIDLSTARLLGHLPSMHPVNAGPKGVQVTPCVFVVESALEPHPSAAEAIAAFWLPLETAASGALDAEYLHPDREMTFPSWNYEGHVIWGLTWRILADVLERAR